MDRTHATNRRSRVRSIHWIMLVALLLVPARAHARDAKPNVAIPVYDDVQSLDQAPPYEMFGQYNLNDVYTVAKDSTPLETYMGMRTLPNYTFADHPEPDILVIPGGATRGVRENAEVQAWVRRNFAVDDRREGAPEVEVVEDAHVVESGKVLTSTGVGSLPASLRIVERLHGERWARVVRLNKEYEPLPTSSMCRAPGWPT